MSVFIKERACRVILVRKGSVARESFGQGGENLNLEDLGQGFCSRTLPWLPILASVNRTGASRFRAPSAERSPLWNWPDFIYQALNVASSLSSAGGGCEAFPSEPESFPELRKDSLRETLPKMLDERGDSKLYD